MSDALRRGIRTFGQISFISAMLQFFAEFGIFTLSATQRAALTAVLLPIVTFAMNWLEDNGTIPALLKAPASEGENPIPAGEPEEPPKKATPRRKK